MASCIFFLPTIYLTVIYARLLYFIGHQTPQRARIHQGRRAQRDLTVARRIMYLVNALTLPVLPNVVFVAMTNLNTKLSGSYFMYRIQWMCPSIAILSTSIVLVLITPKVRAILAGLWTRARRRVAPDVTNSHEQGRSIMQLVSVPSRNNVLSITAE